MISLPNVNLLSWLLTLRMVATQRLQLFNDIKSHVLKRELWMPCEGNPGSRGVDADPIAACPWHVRSFAPSTMSPLWSHACCHVAAEQSPVLHTRNLFLFIVTPQERSVVVSSQLLRPWSFPATTHLHTRCNPPRPPRGPRFAGVLWETLSARCQLHPTSSMSPADQSGQASHLKVRSV